MPLTKTSFCLTRGLLQLTLILLSLNSKLSPPSPESKLQAAPKPHESNTALFLYAKDISLVHSPLDPLQPPTINSRKGLGLHLKSSTSALSWFCSLLILSGDLETNPGPPIINTHAVNAQNPVETTRPLLCVTHAKNGPIRNVPKSPLKISKPSQIQTPPGTAATAIYQNSPPPSLMTLKPKTSPLIQSRPLLKLGPAPPPHPTFDHPRPQHLSLPHLQPTLREQSPAKSNQTSRAW